MVQNNLEVTSLITPLINAFKAMGNEWKELFDIGLTEYLHNQTDKYYFTNTFLHRFEKVRFFDIYFPIKVQYKSLTTQFSTPKEVLEEYKYITIIGTAGSGKSTLTKYIFLNSLYRSGKIPVLIELRHLNEYNGDIEKLISEKILKLSAKPSEGILKRKLQNGEFLFLLDGYDEIFSKKKQDLNRQVEVFVDTYPNNYFIITTRPGSGIERFPRFHDFHVRQLTPSDIHKFMDKLVVEKERKERITSVIKDPNNENYLEYLQNPLLLSMFILAFESHPEIPQKKSAFYRNVFDTLYSKHDGITKNSFPRERKTKLQRDDFEEILNIFSYITLRDGCYAYTEEYLCDKLTQIRSNYNYDFTNDDAIYDLQTSICIFIKDGFEYKFPHRSMQEYFAAQFISKLPTDKKEKAYNILTSKSKEASEDAGYNLWELCSELDYFAFTKFFVLPELNLMNDLIDVTSSDSAFYSFVKLIKPILVRSRSYETSQEADKSKHSSNQKFFFNSTSFYFKLIKFTNAYDIETVVKFPDRPDIRKRISRLSINESRKAATFTKIMDMTDIDLIKNVNVADFLIANGLSDVIINCKFKTLQKIRELETKIDAQKSHLDDIIGW